MLVAKMGRSSAAPLQRKANGYPFGGDSCGGTVAFFVFFAGAAGAGIVTADFCAGANGLGRLGLRGASLILQFFFLALMLALHLAREGGQLLGFGNARSGAGGSS